jgi:epidermal growth factor receptor substrate 15
LPSRQTAQASKAQPDDLEDVKKVGSTADKRYTMLTPLQLCNMGFDRSLVVEALEANGYDFSKTLNVLLT